MFELARRDALVDVHARADIARNPAGDHHQPKKRSATRSHERQKNEYRSGETNRQRRTCNEEEGNAARIVDTGLHEPPAQHLHVLVVCRPVMLRRVLDQPGDRLLAGILQRTRMMGLALFVGQDALRTPLDRTTNANRRHHGKGQGAGSKKDQQPHHHGVAVLQHVPEYRDHCVHGQILKLTMRYMMKLPTPIQQPARVRAIFVRF